MNKEQDLIRMQELSIEMYKIAERLIDDEQRVTVRKTEFLTPIEKLGLSPYAFNCLTRREVLYVEQVARMSQKELSRLRGMGEKTLQLIIDKARELALIINRGEYILA